MSIERGLLALPLRLDVDLGRTPAGLGSNEITTGTAILWVHGRLRLGGGCDAGYGWITRALASSTPSIGMFALDAFALASVDLVDLEANRAIYLAVKPSAGIRWGEDFFAWGHATSSIRATAMAGVRF